MSHANGRQPTSALERRPTYKPIPRILCATDLSPRGEGAVRRALLLAKQMSALLLVLHVVDEAQPAEIIVSQAQRAHNALEARQLTSATEIAVRVGKPSRTIALVAEEWNADLVVLGVHRRRSADHLFGTTAERAIREGSRPVLVVNHEPSEPYRDVLLASDLSDSFTQILLMTQQLGLLEGARVSIVHAARSMIYPAGITQAQIDQSISSLERSARRALVAQLDAAGLDSTHFQIIAKNGTPFHAIASAVDEVQPQLLVMGASHHPALKRLWGVSVANDVLRTIDCDVLLASVTATSSDGYRSLTLTDAWASPWPFWY